MPATDSHADSSSSTTPSPATLPAQRFAGKVVIVTGAGSGIGAATARRFAQEGAMVAIADLSDDKLAATRGDLPADRTLAQATDVSKWEDVQALVEATVQRFGRLDVMVNNAGTGAAVVGSGRDRRAGRDTRCRPAVLVTSG